MRLDQFKVEKAVVEWRWPTAYALWDKAGAIASELSKMFGAGLELSEGAPNKQTFALLNRTDKRHEWSLDAELGKVGITFHSPKERVTDLAATIKPLIAIYVRALEIETFTRVGTRILYARNYPTIEDARAAVLKSNLLIQPEGRVFGFDGAQGSPVIAVSYAAPGVGTTVQIAARESAVTSYGHDEEVGLIDFKATRLYFDIDRFTSQPIAVGAFDAAAWLNELVHVINRDSEKFIGAI